MTASDNPGQRALSAMRDRGAQPHIYQALLTRHHGDEAAILDTLNTQSISHLGGISWAESMLVGQSGSVEAAMDRLGYFQL